MPPYICVCVSLYAHVYTHVSTCLLHCFLCLQGSTGTSACVYVCAHMYVSICRGVYGVNSLQINISREMDVLLRCQVAKQGAVRAALNITY